MICSSASLPQSSLMQIHSHRKLAMSCCFLGKSSSAAKSAWVDIKDLCWLKLTYIFSLHCFLFITMWYEHQPALILSIWNKYTWLSAGGSALSLSSVRDAPTELELLWIIFLFLFFLRQQEDNKGLGFVSRKDICQGKDKKMKISCLKGTVAMLTQCC